MQHDETALRLLEAGATLVSEKGLRPALPRFTLSDVADRAGVSQGSLYQHWPNTEEFLIALAVYLLNKEDDDIHKTGYLLPLLEQGLRGASLMRAWSAEILRVVCANYKWKTKLALWPLVSDPVVKEAVREHYEIIEELDKTPFHLAIAWQGGRVRDGLNIEDLLILRTAMREGLALRSAIDPEAVRDDIRTGELDDSDSSWNLLGLAFSALNASFIENSEHVS